MMTMMMMISSLLIKWRWRATPGWEPAHWLRGRGPWWQHLGPDRSDRAPPSNKAVRDSDGPHPCMNQLWEDPPSFSVRSKQGQARSWYRCQVSVSMSAGSQSRMMTMSFKNGWREKSVWTILYFLFWIWFAIISTVRCSYNRYIQRSNPIHPSTYSFECSIPFNGDLKHCKSIVRVL